MIVCIAEKPSVAKEIAKILGATTRRDGYFEGNGYQVTWAFGHLFHILEPQKMNPSWEKWNLSYLPMIPDSYAVELNADKGCKDQYKVIKQLYKKADRIVNCGDAGQEGELIQRRIMNYAGVKCPVDRLWISSLTEESIKDGFRHLRPQSDFDDLYKAGEARAEGDWLLGMNCTRLYSCKYGNHNVLSIGRVQTPTLAIVVARDKEIENFKPQSYLVLQTTYRGVVFNWFGEFKNSKLKTAENKFTDFYDAHRHLDVAKSHELTINDITKKQGQEQPPQLYDLTSLQVDCNRKFGFSADKTLKTMQSLYEKKVATYPRVDTKYLTHDIYSQCPKILSKLKGYEAFTKELEGKDLPKSKRVFDDSKVTDHHAIIPTGETNSLNSDEQRVYDLICRRFISVFYPPCVYAQTTVIANAWSEYFKATGRTIIDYGWKSLYKADAVDDENKDKEQTLPDFKQGENRTFEYGHHRPELVRRMTTPPKHYTEASLLQAMETAGKFVEDEELREAMKENGIGRPSSRASIIETLLKRNYIIRERKNIVSTDTGKRLISIIKDKMLTSPETTGQWEKKLRLIERGKFTLNEFMSELTSQLQAIVRTVKEDTSNVVFAEPSTISSSNTAKKPDKRAMTRKRLLMSGALLLGKTCPKCGIGIIRKGPYSYFCTEYKNGCKFKKPLK